MGGGGCPNDPSPPWISLFILSQRIHANGYALTVGFFISMRNLYIKLTVCTEMAARQKEL